MKRCSLIAIIVLIIPAFSFTSAQGIVKGKVYDNISMEPLSGVYIIFGNNQGTTTDTDGSYMIETGTGRSEITFRFIGYKSVTRSLDISSNDTIELNEGMEMDLQEIGQIVVSANRTEQKIAELTVSMNVLKASDFLNTHITDPEELVNKTSGIEVMDGQASIRGGTGFSYGAGSRVLALIDGLPMISPDAGNIKWQFLPLENISQVEIIKGASSVLYGSSALNGIINFRTADASNVPNTQFYAEAGVFGNPRNLNWKWWDTPRIFSALTFSHLQKFGKTDIGLGINMLSDNGYRKLNDESLIRLSLRLKHHNYKVKGLVYGLNINSGYTIKRDFVLWEDATYGALKQDTSTVALLHGSYLAVDPYISFNNSGKFTHDLRARFQLSNNRFPVRDQNNSDAYSLYAEYQMTYRLSDLMSITAGLTENYSKVYSNFYGDHDGLNIAAFTQIELNPLPRLKLVAGARIEQNSLDETKDKVVPIFRTGINWQAADYTFLRASFGQGYRYPSIAEKYASTTIGSIKIFPNPYIEAESGWSAETGVKQGILMGETKGQADLAVFISQNMNIIEYLFGNYPDPVTEVFSYGFLATNVEYSRIYGSEIEFSLNRMLGKFNTTLKGGYTFIYPVEFNQATNKNTDTYLKYRRKHSALLSINTSWKRYDLGLNLFAKSKILRIDDVFLNELTREEILPGFYDYWQTHNTGYFMMDGNAGYRISNVLTLSVAVKNITNTEYMGRPGDIQPHRNYSIKLSGNF
jgi:outer membrane cobalamin receptor